jgi:hypothetical protein
MIETKIRFLVFVQYFKPKHMLYRHIVSIFILLLPLFIWGQKPVNISFQGSILGFVAKDKLLGATVYIMQNDRTITKSVSDNYGNYFISGTIDPLVPVDIMISKPGFVPKKVLFDLSALKLNRANSTTLMVLEELTIELFDQKPGVDLSFARVGYAEKFTWDQQSFIAKPDEKQKKDIEEKVKKAYETVKNSSTTSQYDAKARQAAAKKDYQKAIAYYDTALVLVPRDSTMMARKGELVKLWEDQKKEEQKNKELELLIKAADQHLKDNQLDLAENKYKDAQKSLPNDNYIKGQIQKISEIRLKEQEAIRNKQEYERLVNDAKTLAGKKNYTDAITKYNQALTFDPSKKGFIEDEIAKIKKNMSDVDLEEMVKKDLRIAQDHLTKGKLDEALKSYQTTEKNISKFSDQSLVDKYSKEVKDGLQKVQDKKDSEDQAYRAQLAKAIENFNKGRASYSVAKNILNSDPMKSRQNEPEVLDLKDRISKMEEYYLEKENAYALIVKKRDDEAIDRFVKLLNRNVFTQRIAQSEEKQQVQKTLDSLKSLRQKPLSTTIPAPGSTTPVQSTNNLQAPGQLVVGKDAQQVFNDMLTASEKRKASPFEQQQRAKDAYEFDLLYASTLVKARQEEEKNRQLDFANAKEMVAREVSADLVKNQYEQENRKIKTEIESENRDLVAKEGQEKISQIIDNWKDNADYKGYLEKVAIEEQYTAQRNSIEKNKEDNELIARERNQQDLVRQETQDRAIERILLDRFRMDSISRVEQENRTYEVQKLMDYVPEKVYNANNLADETGVPFEKNKMTERVYEIKNTNDEVISIIIRRVVVDKNGYGVVYEQITNDAGQTYHTRNGTPVPDFVWFNESTGENVLSKN